MLAVLEAIAAEQPIGSAALSRLMNIDKSAIQRSVATLSRAGWIAATDERPLRWELSAHLFSIALLPQSSEDLRARVAPFLRELRDVTGETAFMAIPDLSRLVVVEVAESPHTLRTAPRIGEPIPPEHSSTGRAILPYLEEKLQAKLLGREPSEGDRQGFRETIDRGYAASIGEVLDGSTNIAAPIIDRNGRAIAAIAITAPSDRLDEDKQEQIGKLLADSASRLSRKPANRN